MQSSKFNMDSVEAVQASYQSKKHDSFSVKGVISYKTLQALMNSASNTNTNKEKSNSNHVFNLSSSEEESDNGKLLVDDVESPLKNRELKVEKKVDIQLFIDHVHENELTIAEILKRGFCKENRRKIYRIQNGRITSRYFNEIAVKKPAHFDELIGGENYEEMTDSLHDHILSKKIFADIKPVWFCPQIYWVMVAIPTIVWMFLEEKKHI